MSPKDKTFICTNCKHFKLISGGCDAFPNDIPFGMGVNFMHDKPIPGQKNNIVFERGKPKNE